MCSNASIDPLCAGCNTPIGAMPLDIYQRAIDYRGVYLFCPDCRRHKCDVCGWFVPNQDMTAIVDINGTYLGNACEGCKDWVLPDSPAQADFPHFQTMKKPNLRYITQMFGNGN